MFSNSSFGRFSPASFDDIDRGLDDTIEWLESLGIRVQSTRIEAYRKSYDSLLDIYQTKDEAAAASQLAELVFALLEIHDLIEIHKGLSDGTHDEYLRSRLAKLSSGPVRYVDENPSSGNLPRNTAFELLLSARLASAGLPLLKHSTVDIATEVDRKRVLIECKRPQSFSAIERRMKNGFSQLKKQYRNPLAGNVRGIVAIDISKIANPTMNIWRYDKPSDIGKQLGNTVQDFANTFSHTISGSGQRKTIAVIVRLSIMAAPSNDRNNIVYCQQYGINTLRSSRESDQQTAITIGRAIERVYSD